MKILGICGTHNKGGKSASEWFLKQALAAGEERGAQTECIRLVDYEIRPCASCHLCMCDHDCPLFKDPKDEAHKVFDKMAEADAFIFSSPVYSYQQPAIVINLIQRARFFHEVERGRYMGLRSLRSKKNPFAGKPVGNLVVSATIGNETALAGLMHNLRGLGATPVACAGICLLDSVIRDMYKNIKIEKVRQIYCKDFPGYERNQAAIDMARSVGRWVYEAFHSEVFQKIKHYIKL